MAGRAKVPEELERLTKSQRLTVIDEAARTLRPLN